MGRCWFCCFFLLFFYYYYFFLCCLSFVFFFWRVWGLTSLIFMASLVSLVQMTWICHLCEKNTWPCCWQPFKPDLGWYKSWGRGKPVHEAAPNCGEWHRFLALPCQWTLQTKPLGWAKYMLTIQNVDVHGKTWLDLRLVGWAWPKKQKNHVIGSPAFFCVTDICLFTKFSLSRMFQYCSS